MSPNTSEEKPPTEGDEEIPDTTLEEDGEQPHLSVQEPARQPAEDEETMRRNSPLKSVLPKEDVAGEPPSHISEAQGSYAQSSLAASHPDPFAAPSQTTGAALPPLIRARSQKRLQGVLRRLEQGQSICSEACHVHGTCDEMTGHCNCPITHKGADCDIPTMPACHLDNDGIRTMDVSIITTQGFYSAAEYSTPGRDAWAGPVPCACLLQAIQVYAGAEADWTQQSQLPPIRSWAHVICAKIDPQVHAGKFLATPEKYLSSLQPWGRLAVGYINACDLPHKPAVIPMLVNTTHFPPEHEGGRRRPWPLRAPFRAPFKEPWAHLEHLAAAINATELASSGGAGRAIPESRLPVDVKRCSQQCGGRGWCAARQVRKPSMDQAAAAIDGLDRAAAIEPAGAADASCVCFAGHERSAMSCGATWRANDHWWGRSPIAGSPRRRSEAPGCPGACSAAGACVGHGFCHCERLRWGLDCSFGAEAVRRELARKDTAGDGPLIYYYNLPPQFRRRPTDSLPDRLYARLQASGLITADADSADYLMLPDAPSACTQMKEMFDWIYESSPHWKKALGVPDASSGEDSRPPRRLMFFSLDERGWHETYTKMMTLFRMNKQLSPSWESYVAPHSKGRQISVLQKFGRRHCARDPKKHTKKCGGYSFRDDLDIAFPLSPEDVIVPTNCKKLEAMLKMRLDPTAITDEWLREDLQKRMEHGKTFFFAGAIFGPEDSEPSREVPYIHHRNRTGYTIINTEARSSYPTGKSVDEHEAMRSHIFCMLPIGKGGNYGGRYLNAMINGCIPVITAGADITQAYEEILPWHNFAVIVPLDDIPEKMHLILEDLPMEKLVSMRRELLCATENMLWSSVFSPCLGEKGQNDAFSALMQMLLRRINNQTAQWKSVCARA
ncbi:hypothetical protein CYMTET_6717 [Cymbomonas tetramitiformis]|uniref:EGF-like domain-containing protein n=1 Tax=Cymbomonas tetramitiformis TaxID=36881 RepID=A0AAE0GWJ1_9CHLO|nr:hypothetical protein CYMTET_6717 [Cymbomonas tetramitiformis]